MHVLLQGNGEFISILAFVFSTVSDTAIIAPGLNPDCSPIAASASRAATRKPSERVLARRVRAARRDSDRWFGRPLGPRANYPKARFCGRTICVQRSARAQRGSPSPNADVFRRPLPILTVRVETPVRNYGAR